MNIGQLTKIANNLADEDFSSQQIEFFVNDCISKINIEAGANFPFMSVNDSNDYEGFPEKWQRALFIPFVVGRMKAVDSSQFEYNDNYSEFSANLLQFKTKYKIPTKYKDADERTSFPPSFAGNYFVWDGNGATTSTRTDNEEQEEDTDIIYDGGEW